MFRSTIFYFKSYHPYTHFVVIYAASNLIYQDIDNDNVIILIIIKLAPCGTDGRLFTTDVSARFKVR